VDRSFEFGESPLVVGRVGLLAVERVRGLASDTWFECALSLYAADDRIRAAIEIASPDLADALRSAEPAEPLVRRLAKVLLRMAARATPFGAYAGVGLVRAGERSALRVDLHSTLQRGRLDAGWAHDVARAASEQADGDRDVVLWTNASLHRRGPRYFFEHPTARSTEPFATASCKATPLAGALARLAAGGMPLAILSERAAAASQTTAAAARTVARRLLAAGALVRDHARDPLDRPAAAALRTLEAVAPAIAGGVARGTELLHAAGRAPSADAYRAAVAQLRAVTPSARSPIQVDTAVPFAGTLGADVLEAVRTMGSALLALAEPSSAAAPYRDFFYERYEGTERLVPLRRFVDEFEPRPAWRALAAAPAAAGETAGRRESVLAAIAGEAIAERCASRALSRGELDALSVSGPLRLPSTFEIAFHVLASSPQALAAGDFMVAPARLAGSMRAGASAARFDDVVPGLAEAIASFHAAVPDGAEAVEITFTPFVPAHANVLTRGGGTARTFACHGIPAPGALDLDRTYVTVRDARIVLWSEELDRFVTPVQTNMYRTDAYGPRLARFLYAVASDGARLIAPFSWGSLAALPMLPRLTFGKAVLAPMTWGFAQDPAWDDAARLAALDRVRRRWNVPDEVTVFDPAAAEQAIPLDLGSPLGRSVLLETTRRCARVILRETIPGSGDRWLRSDEGSHVAELVVSARTLPAFVNRPDRRPPAVIPSSPRPVFAAGSRWTYVRWYAPEADGDRLARCALDVRDRLATAQLVRTWHFVRYHWPRFHVRVRFDCAEPDRALHEVARLSRELLAGDEILSFDLATYEPEIERYGGPAAMPVVEEAFAASSSAAAAALRPGIAKTDRLLAALTTFHELVVAGSDRDTLASWVDAMTAERKPLTPEERGWKRTLDAFVAGAADRGGGLAERLAETIDDPRSRAQVVRDLAHLHFNRFGLMGAGEASAIRVQWHAYRSRLVRTLHEGAARGALTRT
jgi:lantibiotic biosynthesis protein